MFDMFYDQISSPLLPLTESDKIWRICVNFPQEQMNSLIHRCPPMGGGEEKLAKQLVFLSQAFFGYS